MDIGALENLVQGYFAKGLAPSSQLYKAAQERFLRFCEAGAFTPLPLTQDTVCSYVSYLANQGLKHSTIKVYLTGARYLQIASGFPDPFAGTAWPRLDYVMKGIKKSEAEKGVTTKVRLPVTPFILQQLKEVWGPTAAHRDTKMIWVACCLCFFGFLRAGEMTVPGDNNYDKAIHLSVSDMAVDDQVKPSILQVCIKRSKKRGEPIFREDRIRVMPRCSNGGLSLCSGNGTRPTVPIHWWQSAISSTLCRCSSGCLEEGQDRSDQVLRTQF